MAAGRRFNSCSCVSGANILPGFSAAIRLGSGSDAPKACALPFSTSCTTAASSSNCRSVAFGKYSARLVQEDAPRRHVIVTRGEFSASILKPSFIAAPTPRLVPA